MFILFCFRWPIPCPSVLHGSTTQSPPSTTQSTTCPIISSSILRHNHHRTTESPGGTTCQTTNICTGTTNYAAGTTRDACQSSRSRTRACYATSSEFSPASPSRDGTSKTGTRDPNDATSRIPTHGTHAKSDEQATNVTSLGCPQTRFPRRRAGKTISSPSSTWYELNVKDGTPSS